MSEMPCTAWRRMSSAMRNDSKNPAFCATASSFSLGITMVVSMLSISSASPRSACDRRRRLQKQTVGHHRHVKAPISLASEAIIAPRRYQCRRPTCRDKHHVSPSRASIILSASSKAARRPISGLRPRPSHWSAWCQVVSSRRTRHLESLQVRVATTNSTPSTPAQSSGDSVAAAAAHSDHFDLGVVRGSS